jgi:hypothetical protein
MMMSTARQGIPFCGSKTKGVFVDRASISLLIFYVGEKGAC